jgi:hypothetical protein
MDVNLVLLGDGSNSSQQNPNYHSLIKDKMPTKIPALHPRRNTYFQDLDMQFMIFGDLARHAFGSRGWQEPGQIWIFSREQSVIPS